MGQFSVEKPVAPGSALSGNQQFSGKNTSLHPQSELLSIRFRQPSLLKLCVRQHLCS